MKEKGELYIILSTEVSKKVSDKVGNLLKCHTFKNFLFSVNNFCDNVAESVLYNYKKYFKLSFNIN